MGYIEALKLSKTFGGNGTPPTRAVAPLDLEIGKNEFVALVGPSGCGKSTLLMMLAGLETPTTGHLVLDGETIRGPHPQQAIVFQDYLLFPWKTVADNIAFGPRMRGVGAGESAAVTRRFIELVGLTGFERRYPHELSGGMQQRVAIARALANEPKVLLMDEPFGSLDALTREGLQMELLGIWRRARCTVVFVTHSIAEAIFLADRVVVMSRRPGRIKADLPITLPRPRRQSITTGMAFKAYEERLKQIVWEELAPVTSAERITATIKTKFTEEKPPCDPAGANCTPHSYS
jgi:NitT/TauT family transport system ATP-binding protein